MTRNESYWNFAVEDLPHVTTPGQIIATVDHQGASFTDPMNGTGRGELKLNARDPAVETILSDTAGSLIVARQRGRKTFGWFAKRKIADLDDPRLVKIVGPGVANALYETEVEPFADEMREWMYGQPSILSNTGFEESLEETDADTAGEGAVGTGIFVPTHWELSPHGTVASDGFRIDTVTVDTGVNSLRFNPISQWAGFHQRVRVLPGGTYQASIRHNKLTGVNDDYTLKLKTIEDLGIATNDQTTPGAGIWYSHTLTNVVIPNDVDEVFFRCAYIGASNPDPSYWDTAVLQPGFPAATAGKILNDQFARATARGALLWLDTSTFTDLLDSEGQPWDEALSMRIRPGRSIGDILDVLAKLGYEWRVTWSDILGWHLRVVNPSTFGTDRTLDPTPAILEGRDISGGDDEEHVPAATAVRAYGANGLTSVAVNAPAIANFGRIERSVRDLNLSSQATVDKFALQQLSARLQLSATQWEVKGAADSVPYFHYLHGDTLWTAARGKRIARRVFGFAVEVDPKDPVGRYEVEMDGVLVNEAAAKSAGLARLLTRVRDLEDSQDAGGPSVAASAATGPVVVGGALPDIYVASSDAPQAEKDLAEYVCDGTSDWATFQSMITDIRNTYPIGTGLTGQYGPTVRFTMGRFFLTTPALDALLHFNFGLDQVRLLGAGGTGVGEANRDQTTFVINGPGGAFAPIVFEACTVEGISFDVLGPTSLTWSYHVQFIERSSCRECSFDGRVIVGGPFGGANRIGSSHGTMFHDLVWSSGGLEIRASGGGLYSVLHVNNGLNAAGIVLDPMSDTVLNNTVFTAIRGNFAATKPLILIRDTFNPTLSYQDNLFTGLHRSSSSAGPVVSINNTNGKVGINRYNTASMHNSNGALLSVAAGAVPGMIGSFIAPFASASVPPATSLPDGAAVLDTGTDELCIVRGGAYRRVTLT